MANTLRGVYDTDVLIAAANSFTGSVLAADYTEKMAASMIMPNSLLAYQRTMNGAELTETVRAFVEGCEGGFTPFNRGSLPVVSGIAIEVKEENGGFVAYDSESSESIAQVIVALTELGVSLTDSRFVKSGNTLVSRLLEFRTENGAFRHILDGEEDVMATEQGFYALVAVSRAEQGKSTLYTMTEA